MSAASKKAHASHEVRAKMSAALKKAYASPEARAKMSAAMKKAYALAAQGHAPYESSLERRVVKYCKARGWLCLKMDPRYYKGIPDRLIVLPSMVVWMEFKRPDGKGSVSRHQVKAHQTLERLGMYVIVVDNYEAALRAMGA